MNLTTQSEGLGPNPRAAATVVLLRESQRGAEVLLTIRPKHLAFMGGAAVFPGGAVDEGDLHPSWEQASALSRLEAAKVLGIPDGEAALGAFVCAVREAFEEVGWLPGPGSRHPMPQTEAATGEGFRRGCLEAGIVLATDRLVFAGRWVTPLGSPRRFDTRFFVSRVEPGWEPSPATGEVEDCLWMTPPEALAKLAAGELLMAPPTIEMLQRLEAHREVDGMMAAIEARGLEGAGSVVSTRLSPLVHVVLAPNPGLLTGPGTNSYVVGNGPTCVIDPAVSDFQYLESLLEAAKKVDSILITHRHPDHVGGVAALATRTGAPVRAFGSEEAGGVRVESVADGDVIEVAGAELTCLHTPGHSPDHVCFYMRATASLFSGDNILGEGTPVIAPPEGNMRAYLDSLRWLSQFQIERVYPGHFRPLDDGNAVIRNYLSHRDEREKAILRALKSGPATVESIVEVVYTDVPADLHTVARFSVLAHLELAESDGRVARIGAQWKLRAES